MKAVGADFAKQTFLPQLVGQELVPLIFVPSSHVLAFFDQTIIASFLFVQHIVMG